MIKFTQRERDSGPHSVNNTSKQKPAQDKQRAYRLPTDKLSEPSSVAGSDGNKQNFWKLEEDKKLRQYWNAGLPASKIVKLLNNKRTRMAIIARAHRLGLMPRVSLKSNRKLNNGIPYQIATTYNVPNNFIKLNDPWPYDVCKFPIFQNHIRENQPIFCGEPIALGCGSYCTAHHELTHTRPYARNDNARAL
jgi:hypothetical protein